ncbi:MAG: NUDIX domain-containing protein [Lachnospiraceae bacterium]|nr:NUDIX domain-containing protein [Lachnospiraceae bacterium]
MELLDIVDMDGNPTGRTVERTIAHRDGIWHRTSHVWLVRKNKDKIEVLLQKRSVDKDSYPGCYDTSSAGHIPAGCGYEESAVRELQEELGIKAEEEELYLCGRRTVYHDEIFYGEKFIDRQISNVYYLWRDLEPEEFDIQKEELESVRWMEIHECINMVKYQTEKNCVALEEIMMVAAAIEKKRRVRKKYEL